MDSTETIYFLISSLTARLPQLFVMLGGIFYCISQMSKDKKAGKTALIGLGIMLFTTLLGIILGWGQAQLSLWYRGSYQTIGYINLAINTVQGLIWSIGFCFLIYAVWVGRTEKNQM